MTTAEFSDHDIEAVHALSRQVAAVVQGATPAIALNALLTAYLNTASAAGVLHHVPGAAAALTHAAQQMSVLQGAAEIAPTGTSIH